MHLYIHLHRALLYLSRGVDGAERDPKRNAWWNHGFRLIKYACYHFDQNDMFHWSGRVIAGGFRWSHSHYLLFSYNYYSYYSIVNNHASFNTRRIIHQHHRHGGSHCRYSEARDGIHTILKHNSNFHYRSIRSSGDNCSSSSNSSLFATVVRHTARVRENKQRSATSIHNTHTMHASMCVCADNEDYIPSFPSSKLKPPMFNILTNRNVRVVRFSLLTEQAFLPFAHLLLFAIYVRVLIPFT